MSTLELKNDIIRFIASTNDDHILSQIKEVISSIESEQEEEPEMTKEDLKNDLIEAFRDARLHQQGKKKLPNIEDVLNEL